MFHTSVLETLGSDLIRQPTVFCQRMNIEELIMANKKPSGSSAVNSFTDAMLSAVRRFTVAYRRFSANDLEPQDSRSPVAVSHQISGVSQRLLPWRPVFVIGDGYARC